MSKTTIGQLNGFWALAFKTAVTVGVPGTIAVVLWAANVMREENRYQDARLNTLEMQVAAVPKDLVSGAEINRRLESLERKTDQLLVKVADLALQQAEGKSSK